ncbi:MAG: FxsA family protein [Candidatus Sumerlaeota bacterium]|nr:FxsA family protein [Candidatus Sumerlaeota bacterium]
MTPTKKQVALPPSERKDASDRERKRRLGKGINLLLIILLFLAVCDAMFLIVLGSSIGTAWTILGVAISTSCGIAAESAILGNFGQLCMRLSQVMGLYMRDGASESDLGHLMAEHKACAFVIFLFLVPGFVSDFVGWTLLVPPVHRWFVRRLQNKASD